MEDWVLRALARWPDVPALFGWLGLDRRGRWLIRGETISRPQIIETINRNYGSDAYGRWYFQNGPQRGYVELAYAPLVLWLEDGAVLRTHTGRRVQRVQEAFLDEEGSLVLSTEHGPAVLHSTDLGAVLDWIRCDGAPMQEDHLMAALALPSGVSTPLSLRLPQGSFPLRRLDVAELPHRLGFVRRPEPRPEERAAGALDNSD